MANALYAKFKRACLSRSGAGLSAAVDLETDTVKAALVAPSYTPSLVNDQFFTAISANVVGTPQALTFTSDTAGVYKCSNPSFAGIASATATYLVVYKDTGTAATSPLIAFIDTASGLPYTAGSSTTLDVAFDAAGVFTL